MKVHNLTKASQGGMTLIELIIAIAILAILTSVAIPGFKSLLAGKSIESIAKVFEQSVRSARSQAADRNVQIRVRPINNDWAEGWQLEFTNAGGNNEIINQIENTTNTLLFSSPNFSALTPLTFAPSGTAVQTGTFTMRFADCSLSNKLYTYTILVSGLLKRVQTVNPGC